MLYLLPALLFALANAATEPDCNAIVVGGVGFEADTCISTRDGSSNMYACAGDDTITAQTYNTTDDCSGDSTDVEDFCTSGACTGYCGKNSTCSVVTMTYYAATDCTGDADFTLSTILDLCAEGTGAYASARFSCIGGTVSDNMYTSDDCSGEATTVAYTEDCYDGVSYTCADWPTTTNEPDCNAIVLVGSPFGFEADTCIPSVTEEVSSNMYACADDDTITAQTYTTGDCSGDSTEVKDFCGDGIFCTGYCGKTGTCSVATMTRYAATDCTGEASYTLRTIVDLCIGGTGASKDFSCSGGTLSDNMYTSDDCSGDATVLFAYTKDVCYGGVYGASYTCADGPTDEPTTTDETRTSSDDSATMCFPSDLGCMSQTVDGTSSYEYDCDAEGAWQTTVYFGVDDCSGTGASMAGVVSVLGGSSSYMTCGGACENYMKITLEGYASTDCSGDSLGSVTMVEGFEEDAGECEGPDDDGKYSTAQCAGTNQIKNTYYSDSECSADAEEEIYGVGTCIETDGMSIKPTAIYCKSAANKSAANKIGVIAVFVLCAMATLFN